MKTASTCRNHLGLALSFAFVLIGLGAPGVAPRAGAQEMTPIIPVGSLSAFPTIVQTGTHPQLTWSVTVPEAVLDVVTIDPPGTLLPNRCLKMNVRVLGASVMAVWSNAAGHMLRWEWVPTEARINVNGTGFNRIFFDTQDHVNPSYVVHSQTVRVGDRIDFGGRYQFQGEWGPWFSSTNSANQVVALKNGDIPPTTTPLHEQPDIETFLLPYLDEQGRIKLGARDVIYLMELTHTDVSHAGYDLQDLVLLVTFYDEITNENGDVVDCEGNIIPPAAPAPTGGGDGGSSGSTDTGSGGGDSDGSSSDDGSDSGSTSGNSKSGLGDGTNPGKGKGTANSPNQGTNNPNQAGNRSK